MEFSVLLALPLPATCRKIVTQFLREPHPTATLIKVVRFQYDVIEYHDGWRCLVITGPSVRVLHRRKWPPSYECGVWGLAFCYDAITGESNYPSALDMVSDSELSN